jgi:hypothetical protein
MALFLVCLNLFGLTWAIVGATVTSVVIIVYRRKKQRRLGWLLPVTLGYAVIRGGASLLTDSEDVYLAFGLGSSALFALAIATSAFIGRPAARHLIPAVVMYPPVVVEHPLYHRVAAQLTVAWAAAELAITGWEATHLGGTTANEFVFLRTFVGWPAMALWIAVLIFYLRMRLDPLQYALARSLPPRWGTASREHRRGHRPDR